MTMISPAYFPTISTVIIACAIFMCTITSTSGRSFFSTTLGSFTSGQSSSPSSNSIQQHSQQSSSIRSPTKLNIVHEIKSLEDFEKYISNASDSTLPVVVDFQKGQCKPCVRAAPIFSSLSDQYKDKASFYKVDADAWSGALALMKGQGVKSVPTFQIWQQGRRLHSVAGAKALEEFEQLLLSALSGK